MKPKKNTAKYIKLPVIYFLSISNDEKINNDDVNESKAILKITFHPVFLFFLFVFSVKINLIREPNKDSEKNIIRSTGSLSIKFSISNEMFCPTLYPSHLRIIYLIVDTKKYIMCKKLYIVFFF